jgi:hypothetical protein
MNCELIYASDFEEFFYCENDWPVSEGNPVGVEIDRGHEIEFILFDEVYHEIKEESY